MRISDWSSDVCSSDLYDAATREQVVAGVIQTFDYLFEGLLGADLTAKQSVFFRFVARLLLALPETLGRNATILDMIALMDDPGPYLPAIASLTPPHLRFFERAFQSQTFHTSRHPHIGSRSCREKGGEVV